ncbi:universal stress protein [Siansivirga zeaxanthinifaciens]|uniref:Universal stress protein n=1 Tax=Siansivirga zeaxanthinifaciens CC-SAMT-1 TaxID=1454006 RepID=A0A0C5W9W2_9FLAO|nr:universal stress protein [Siansivirga zeaxanthinifaciens]AJR03923.1 universal stress protein [Siansivirga zeaxanthinifaciens CC-SAMT-1]
MKTILLPTDFSINSINAINYAIELYKNETCKFYLLNVQRASSFISDDMMAVTSTATIYNTIIDAAKKSLSNIIKRINKHYNNPKHTFETLVDYDNFIDSINQVSELKQIDLIIMGTKGATGLKQVVFGSNTVKVIQRCHLPVLVIPENCKFSNLKDVTFTTSYATLYEGDDLKPLKEIINLNESKLSVLHVFCDYDFAVELDKNIDFFNKNFEHPDFKNLTTNEEHVFEIIESYIKDNNVKMLAMKYKSHSLFERLFYKLKIESVAYSINIPLLVIK